MANTASAKKRARQAVKARARNAGQRSMIRTTIKKVVKALDANDKAAAQTAYAEMVPVLDRYANRGMIHKNKAARHKSRLTARIVALA
ncbi:30S ribosomal protein S20 [Panacagrimonas sp.]|uniref:30S ribosomal protein S20 n=1 Tax=Panacagrimonas sp. TaxID=2480088 RepID=UPI003B5288F6